MRNQERRGRTRVEYKTSVDIMTDTKTLANLHIKNLSLKGIYLETESALPLDTICKLNIKLSFSPEMRPVLLPF